MSLDDEARIMRRVRRSNAGFTMIEALVAVALMGLIMGALATLTAQWLPNWNRGLLRVQRNEQVAIALERLAADLSAAEYVAPNRESLRPLFDGGELAVTFVRTAVGPNTRPGLEIVRIAETADALGRVLVRMRAPFVPLPIGDLSLEHIPFADPVVLVRAPLRVTFAYPDNHGGWKSTWQAPTWPGVSPGPTSAGLPQATLPTAIRFTVRDTVAERILAVSTATRVHVDLSAPRPEQVEEAPDPVAAQPQVGGMATGGRG
jgi:general secretion pathway protein J